MFFEDSERDQAKVLSLIGTKDEKEKFKREVLMRKKNSESSHRGKIHY